MDRFEARVAVREALRAQGRIVAEKRPYRHSVGHTQRAPHEPIEPRLSLQWFVKVGPLAKAAGDAVRDGRVVVHPKELEPRWFAWVDNMYDWCISRQLWWGHRIPVWYGPGGRGRLPGARTRSRRPAGRRTTTSSTPGSPPGCGRSPRSAGRTTPPDLRRYYPTSVLVTGYDILFFWVARMMMFGLYAMDGEPPFDTIALHGMVRDEHGKKMSKSAGNTVDPLAWMDRFGTDAVRFALARGANPGTDMPLGEDAVVAARNFTTKLWNATRFALANGATVELPLPAEARAHRRRPLDPRAAARGRASRSTRCWRTSSSPRPPRRSTTSRGTSSATGTSSWPSRSCATRHGGRAPARCSGTSWTRCSSCCTRSSPFLTETLWTALTGGESVVDRAVAGRGRARRSTPPRRRGSPTCRSWSPRSAGSAPSRGSRTAAGSPPGSSGLDVGGLGAHGAAVAGPAGRAGRRLRADGHGRGRAVRRPRARRARHLGRDRRRRRARPAGPRPGRGAEGARHRREEAGQPEVRGEGARRGRRRHPRRGGARRPRTSSGSRRGWRRCS